MMFGVCVLNRSCQNTKFQKGEPFKKVSEETFLGKKNVVLQHARLGYTITVKESELKEEFDLIQ